MRLVGGLHGYITLMPIFWHDSPCYSPYPSPTWLFYNGVLYIVLRIRWLLGGMTKSVQDTGSQLWREIGHILTSILHWMTTAYLVQSASRSPTPILLLMSRITPSIRPQSPPTHHLPHPSLSLPSLYLPSLYNVRARIEQEIFDPGYIPSPEAAN
ncbi:hypothetical protein BGW80DRAFT_1421294 [Lactifluus volemus]|nr:hypothetical protein BGW80DRAFT_1421294 [Lactifluus volemus]